MTAEQWAEKLRLLVKEAEEDGCSMELVGACSCCNSDAIELCKDNLYAQVEGF